MGTDTANVNFICPKCNGGTIEINPSLDDPDSSVSCGDASCGIVFDQTWGEVKLMAKEQVADELFKSLKNSKFWKVSKR